MKPPYSTNGIWVIDAELVRRGKDFLERKSTSGDLLFLFIPIVNPRFPTLPYLDFKGNNGYGGNADCMMEMGHRVGEILDKIDKLATSMKEHPKTETGIFRTCVGIIWLAMTLPIADMRFVRRQTNLPSTRLCIQRCCL